MGRRPFFILLAAAGGIIAALLAATIWALVSQAFGWIFLFGDDPWPNSFLIFQAALLYVIGCAAFLAAAIRIYRALAGK